MMGSFFSDNQTLYIHFSENIERLRETDKTNNTPIGTSLLIGPN